MPVIFGVLLGSRGMSGVFLGFRDGSSTMQTLAEKRVYGDRSGISTVLVGGESGLVVVTISGTSIGEFSMPDTEPIADVRATPLGTLLATPDGTYRWGDPTGEDGTHEQSDRIGRSDRAQQSDRVGRSDRARRFDCISRPGAVAIGLLGDGLLIGGEDGTIYRLPRERWTGEARDSTQHVVELGTVGEIRSIDGPLIAAADGVYRIDGGLTYVGLDDANDVLGRGTPIAATDDGLYVLGNGWMDAVSGRFDRVAGDGHGTVHAAGEAGLFVKTGDRWERDSLSIDGRIAAIAHGGGRLAAVTTDGQLHVADGTDRDRRHLGVSGVRAVAIVPETG